MKKNHLLLVLFGVLGVLGLGYLLWWFPHVMESEDNLAYLIRSLLLLCFLIPSVFLHRNAPEALRYGACWGGIFLVLFVGYSYHEDLGNV